MTFMQFLSVLRARWWVLLLVFVLVVAGAVGVSMLLPKQYTAAGSVLIDVKPDPISAVVYGGAANPALMATQIDIIQSDRVTQRVIRNLKLNEIPAIQAEWRESADGRGTVEQWLVPFLRKNLDVQPGRESTVVTVSYKAQDPRFAAAIANAFIDAYVQTALELRVDPARSYTGYFDARAKDAREVLEKAQTKLSSFQSKNGIIATDERLDVENARLNELSSQLVALQAVAAESRSRQAQANSSQGDKLQEVLNNPLIAQLKSEISRGEARLQELDVRYGDKHPQVMEAKANLEELRARMLAETKRVTGGVSVTNTINREREAQVRVELEAQRAKVLRMKAVRDEGLVLQREVESAQRSFDAITARFQQTSLESQTPQSNVNILSRAEPPIEPSSPRMILNTLIAVFMGTLLGLGITLLAELRDRRVRGVADAAQLLDVPVIGIMTRPGSRSLLGRQRISSFQQRLMAPQPGAKGSV